jgi:hypothetical protein
VRLSSGVVIVCETNGAAETAESVPVCVGKAKRSQGTCGQKIRASDSVGHTAFDRGQVRADFAKRESNKESNVDLFVMNEKKHGALPKNIVRDVGDRVGREISVKHGTKRQFLKGLEKSDPQLREVVSSHVVLRGVDDFCNLMWRHHGRQ